MALPTTKVDICNLALDRIGAKTVTDAQITANTDPVAVKCNRNYEQTRDALQQSFWWRFNKERIILAAAWVTARVYTTDQFVIDLSVWYKCKTAHTSSTSNQPPNAVWTTLATADVTPDFEFTFEFDLPDDYLCKRRVFEDNTGRQSTRTYAIEADKFRGDDATVEFIYSKRVTDVTLFDALYIEALSLTLAKKFATAIAKDAKLEEGVTKDLGPVMSKVRTVHRQEQNTLGRNDLFTHNDARRAFGHRIPSQLGSG